MSGKSWFRIENKADEYAEIFVQDEIGAWGVTSKDFIDDLNAVDKGLVKLHLNSPGGSVTDGIAIFNALKSHSATVDVYVDALAASIATVIAMGGDRVIMAPHSRMMIHEAMAMGLGYAEDFEKVAQNLRETTENIASIYAERTGKEAAYWLPLMKAETRFTDQQAVDEGLADEIGRDLDFGAFKVAADFTLTGFREAALVKAELAQVTPDDGLTPEERAAVRELLAERRAQAPDPGTPPPDPRDAARRELEARLAAVGV